MKVVQITKDPTQQTPKWAWALGLLPWAWVIPFNQYFWDDWIWSATTDFDWHLDYWLLKGAKHFIDPFIYPTLVSIGAWSFGVLTLMATAIAAWSLSEVVRGQVWASPVTKQWIGPMFLVIPVFHSRFSAAVLEYSLSLAALLVAWWILVSRNLLSRLLLAVPLLIFAIGVPSLALLYPLLYLHVVLGQSSLSQLRLFRKALVTNCYILVIPACFAVIFSIYVNDEGKYSTSSGALIEFFRGLLVLLVVGSLILGVVFGLKRSLFKYSLLVIGSGVAVYLSFSPYFAVGYNPLADFLPWRMRTSVKEGLAGRAALTVSVFLLLGIAIFLRVRPQKTPLPHLRISLVLVVSVFFATAMVVLGPMDWESRHWLIAWPALALFFILIIAAVRVDLQHALSKSVFFVFLAASLVISSEYLVDSLKQKAIVSTAGSELREFALEQTTNGAEVLVVISPTRSMNNLNARFRSYRPYEWWGILANGMTIQPSQLKVLALGDVLGAESAECPVKYDAIRISPDFSTGRLRALSTFRVQVELNPEPIVLCSKLVKEGWPRDPLP